MAAEYRTLKVDKENGVDWVTLNRPERLNTFTATLVRELNAYLAAAAGDPDCRIVVIRGAGRAFCAGLDIKEVVSDSPDALKGSDADTLEPSLNDIVRNMRRMPQPVIAMLNGDAAGGGFGLALAADIRIASETARMNAAFIKVGLSGCEMGTSYFLPRIVGMGTTIELLYTGRFIDAHRALAVGLVSAVAKPEELEACVRGWVADMLAATPLGLRRTKELLAKAINIDDLDAVLDLEARQQGRLVHLSHRERLEAFLDRRTNA